MPVLRCGLQKPESTDHVGLDEVLGAMDGAVHMRLGRKVDDGAWPVLGQQARDQRTVANVAMHKHMARIALQAGQVVQVAGVGELVEVEHGLVRAAEPVEHEVGAYEAGAAGDQDHGGSLV